MSMSSHVVGFRPRDEKFEKFLKIFLACQEAKIDPPNEVISFFDEEPNPEDLPGFEVDIKQAVVKYNGNYKEGFDVHLDKLPKDIKVVRFYNAY